MPRMALVVKSNALESRSNKRVDWRLEVQSAERMPIRRSSSVINIIHMVHSRGMRSASRRPRPIVQPPGISHLTLIEGGRPAVAPRRRRRARREAVPPPSPSPESG
jgi:hypothetical protein